MKPLKTKSGNFIGIKGTNRIIGVKEVPKPSTYPKRHSYIVKINNHNC